MSTQEFRRITLGFSSGGTRCLGHLHLPLHHPQPPVVLMGNGLATEWHFGTADFIRAFTAAGMATFNFDYRHFGASCGEPRQLVSFARQLDDWRAALAFLRTRAEINPARIALWGSSLGGGHALSLAAENSDLRAVVAQVPHLNSREALKAVPKWQLLRTLAHALRDKGRAWRGLSPHTLPVLAEPGELALLNKPGWKKHYLSLVPSTSAWRNAVPARSIFTAGNYNPIDVLDRLHMPVMIAYALADAAIPAVNVEIASQRIKEVVLLPFDDDHFGVYAGPWHEEIVTQETEFLRNRLY
ncbi:MAG: alpha/beta fold hydrolase [Sterolibacterium sp.]|nr:alpha/beta fold hydrolase [Sterolibacterium sp.]